MAKNNCSLKEPHLIHSPLPWNGKKNIEWTEARSGIKIADLNASKFLNSLQREEDKGRMYIFSDFCLLANNKLRHNTTKYGKHTFITTVVSKLRVHLSNTFQNHRLLKCMILKLMGFPIDMLVHQMIYQIKLEIVPLVCTQIYMHVLNNPQNCTAFPPYLWQLKSNLASKSYRFKSSTF